MLVYIESILKQITNRTYQIKNAIEFMRFNAGVRLMNEDWIYEDDDFDPDGTYIELQFGPEDLHLIYKSVSVHLDRWATDILMNKADFNI